MLVFVCDMINFTVRMKPSIQKVVEEEEVTKTQHRCSESVPDVHLPTPFVPLKWLYQALSTFRWLYHA